ncbi:MAG: hypothetical protein EYC62_07595 [Alphaproteobacteria bacterium]|nr:MAG: hypothetical protein EYC62_07595 [Alphaproteobacteria bacterium]
MSLDTSPATDAARRINHHLSRGELSIAERILYENAGKPERLSWQAIAAAAIIAGLPHTAAYLYDTLSCAPAQINNVNSLVAVAQGEFADTPIGIVLANKLTYGGIKVTDSVLSAVEQAGKSHTQVGKFLIEHAAIIKGWGRAA